MVSIHFIEFRYFVIGPGAYISFLVLFLLFKFFYAFWYFFSFLVLFYFLLLLLSLFGNYFSISLYDFIPFIPLSPKFKKYQIPVQLFLVGKPRSTKSYWLFISLRYLRLPLFPFTPKHWNFKKSKIFNKFQ